MAGYGNNKSYKKPTTMLRVVWTNSEAGDVVKFYNAHTLADVKDMKGFFVKSWKKVRSSTYAALCFDGLKRKVGV
jgi:hypothetical protein